MDFDANKEKKKIKAQRQKKEKISGNKISGIYPISGVTEGKYIKIKLYDHEYFSEVFNIKKYDLNTLSVEEAVRLEDEYNDLVSNFDDSIKEIFRNFPERNKPQQKYFKELISRTTDPKKLEWLKDQLSTLIYLEKTYSKYASWLMIYGESETDLQKKIKELDSYKSTFGFYPVTYDEKELIFKLINNPGGLLNE